MTPFLSILILPIPATPHLLVLTSGNTDLVEAVQVQQNERAFDVGSNNSKPLSLKLNNSRDLQLTASSLFSGCSRKWGMTAYLEQLLGSGMGRDRYNCLSKEWWFSKQAQATLSSSISEEVIVYSVMLLEDNVLRKIFIQASSVKCYDNFEPIGKNL